MKTKDRIDVAERINRRIAILWQQVEGLQCNKTDPWVAERTQGQNCKYCRTLDEIEGWNQLVTALIHLNSGHKHELNKLFKKDELPGGIC
jgi:hypothetical protein